MEEKIIGGACPISGQNHVPKRDKRKWPDKKLDRVMLQNEELDNSIGNALEFSRPCRPQMAMPTTSFCSSDIDPECPRDCVLLGSGRNRFSHWEV